MQSNGARRHRNAGGNMKNVTSVMWRGPYTTTATILLLHLVLLTGLLTTITLLLTYQCTSCRLLLLLQLVLLTGFYDSVTDLILMYISTATND